MNAENVCAKKMLYLRMDTFIFHISYLMYLTSSSSTMVASVFFLSLSTG